MLMLNNWEVSSVGSRRLETRVLDLLLKYAKVRQMNGDIISISDDDVADIKVLVCFLLFSHIIFYSSLK